MAKKKTETQKYTWLIIAAIVVIAIIVFTSGGEGGTLAKFAAAKGVIPSPVTTVKLNPTDDANILATDEIGVIAVETNSRLAVMDEIGLAYIKFDLRNISAGRKVTNATLVLTEEGYTNLLWLGATNASWSEATIKTPPHMGTELGRYNEKRSTYKITFDVTSYVAANVGKQISFGLSAGSNVGGYQIMNRETTSGPYLEITYT